MSYPNSNPGASGSGPAAPVPEGIGLSNTIHSEVAPCLPLPSLPVFCGASDPEVRLLDGADGNLWSLNRNEILSQSERIADLLRQTDVSYLNLRDETRPTSSSHVEPLELHDEVLRYNPEAFEYVTPGPQHSSGSTLFQSKPFEAIIPASRQTQRDFEGTQNHQIGHVPHDTGPSLRKNKVKKKGKDEIATVVHPDPTEVQDSIVGGFCDTLEDFLSRAEIPIDERVEQEWLSMPLTDIGMLVKEITTIRSKKLLHLVPVDILVRLLRFLDHQIHRAEGLSLGEYEHVSFEFSQSDSEVVSSLFSALESIHAALAIMAHSNMPRQLYKEEIIERILELFKCQITDVMSAYDPSYRALHRPGENGAVEDDEGEPEADYGSASKRRRTVKSVKVKKSVSNRVSAAMNTILHKLCTILGLLKDLLLVEKLSDSCILQLVKTSFTTLLVENIQLLQLKAIALISGIFYSYTQHRTYIMDEIVQLLWKLPISKRALRSYLLPDEEQKQIQMITALLIQLVHSSANLPETLRLASSGTSILEISLDVSYPSKARDAVTETCCLFWSRVLERIGSVKAQDSSEMKLMMDNLVSDLLTTLNLPKFPASSLILEVLCVLLLQNAGLKSKDIAARSMAIDILGNIAARLKHDALICRQSRFWILQELAMGDDASHNPKDACCICLDGRVEKRLCICQGCGRLFHADCIGMREYEAPNKNWNCQICLCKKQLLVLQSYSKSHYKDEENKATSRHKKNSEASNPVTKLEIVQQILLNYLQDAVSSDDLHVFVRWFVTI
ncbi:hypothetical protein Tsubulata_004087 [Turnera subulata]|uniref:PHD-type domain-containing protein n=1 Tax=Turnera subulata TaxID=218843 RepID=A0A9Q0J2U5_9ROSI|nr:hypothetical protein Tsubulata_004087 [Turnera subulata]